MPAVAIVFPRRSAASSIPASGSEIREVSGEADDRGDRDHRQALVVRQQDLGLVRDREVRAAGSHLADRRRGVGWNPGVDGEAGLLEVAALQRGEQPGVVGVDVEVERDVESLRLDAVGTRLLLLTTGRGQQRQRREGEGEGEGETGRSQRISFMRRSQSAALVGERHQASFRSSSAIPPKSTIASTESTATAANTRAVCN